VDCFSDENVKMGYFEHVCQLCGVSFAIARLRRADEPREAAWNYSGTGVVEYEDETGHDDCGSTEGEHIAGPECHGVNAYSGHRISVEEMKV